MADDFDGRDARGGILPESIRKALVSGISALFMTEEGIRNMLSDMRLPKDAMAYLVQQTERTRKELFRVISHELQGFLKNADLNREVRKALRGLKVQIRADIRFVDEEGEPVTEVNARVREAEPRKGRTRRTPAAAKASEGDPPVTPAPRPARRKKPRRS